MFIHERRAWRGAEKSVTPESGYLNRREFVAAMGVGAIGVIGSGFVRRQLREADRAVAGAGHGPFVEYGPDRDVARVRAREARGPNTIEIGGLVRRPIRVDVDELVRRFTVEERAYRFRCVEGWAAVVPWMGFGMRELVAWCRPTSAAKHVRFAAGYEPERMTGIVEQPWHGWPYAEGLTIGEAVHELTFVATGRYGSALRVEQGGPLRLIVPWKYGHKSIKGIARIEFVADRPATFWNSALPFEYSFEANVDPRVPHPRWSQEFEVMVGTGERVRTRLYNGYGEQVAGIYRQLVWRDYHEAAKHNSFA